MAWPFTRHLLQSSHVTSEVQRGWTGAHREGQRMRGCVNDSRRVKKTCLCDMGRGGGCREVQRTHPAIVVELVFKKN